MGKTVKNYEIELNFVSRAQKVSEMRNLFEHQDNKPKSKYAIQYNKDLSEIKDLSFSKLPAPTLSTNAIQRRNSSRASIKKKTKKNSSSKNGQDYQIYSNTNATNTQDNKVATNEIGKTNGAIPKVTHALKKPIPAPRSAILSRTKSIKDHTANPQVNESLDRKNDTHFTTPRTAPTKTKFNGNTLKTLAPKRTPEISRAKTENFSKKCNGFDGVDTNNTSFIEASQFGYLNEFRQSMIHQIDEYLNEIRINGFDTLNTESEHLSKESFEKDDGSDSSSDQEELQKYFEDNFPNYANVEKYDYLKKNMKDKLGDGKNIYKSKNKEDFLEYEVVDHDGTYLENSETDSEEEYFDDNKESDPEELMNDKVVNTQENENKIKNADPYSRKSKKSKIKYHIYDNMDECFILDQNFLKLSIEGSNTDEANLNSWNIPSKEKNPIKYLGDYTCTQEDKKMVDKNYEPISTKWKNQQVDIKNYPEKQTNRLLEMVQSMQDTEVQYLQELEHIIPVYKNRIRNHPSMAIQTKAGLICATIEKLLEYQIKFNDFVQAADESEKSIMRLFLNLEELFRIYKQFLLANLPVINLKGDNRAKVPLKKLINNEEFKLSVTLMSGLARYKSDLEKLKNDISQQRNNKMLNAALSPLSMIMELQDLLNRYYQLIPVTEQNIPKVERLKSIEKGTEKLDFWNVPPKPNRSLKPQFDAAYNNPDDESDVKYYEPIQVNWKKEHSEWPRNGNSYGNKQSNKLFKIVQELQETENRYVQELKNIIPVYKYGIKNHSSLLIRSKAQNICLTIDKLLELQIEFEDMIKNADDLVKTIPQIFMDFETLFRKYRQCLVENESVIISVVPDVENSKMEISLSSILTHRLVHYKRFLEDIRDEMSRCNPNMFQTILCSLNTLMEILQSCNIMLALAKIQNIPLHVDKNGKLGDVTRVPSSNFVQGCPFDVSGYGDLLLQDKFEVKKHSKGLLTVFLFEKIILLTKEVPKEKFLYQGHIDMDRVRLLHDDRKNILKLEYVNESKQPYKLTYRLKGDPKTIEKWYNKIFYDCLWTQKLVVKEEVTERYEKTTKKAIFYDNIFL